MIRLTKFNTSLTKAGKSVITNKAKFFYHPAFKSFYGKSNEVKKRDVEKLEDEEETQQPSGLHRAVHSVHSAN